MLRRSRRHAAAMLASLSLIAAVPVPLTLQVFLLRRECDKTEREAVGQGQRLQAAMTAEDEMDAQINRWTRLAQSQQARRTWEAAFPSLAACLPDDVFLQEIQMSYKDGGAQVQMQGSAGTVAGLRSFTTALARSPAFARLHLDETTAGSGGLTFQVAGPLSGGIAAGAPPSAN